MLAPWFLMNRILDTFCAYLCFASVCVFWIVWMKCYCEKKLIVEDKCVLFLCVIEKRHFLFLFLFLCFQIKSCSIEWRIKTEDDRLIKCYLWFILQDKTFQAKKLSRFCKKKRRKNMDPRRRNHVEEAGTCIPGLGDNKPRPRKTYPYYILSKN